MRKRLQNRPSNDETSENVKAFISKKCFYSPKHSTRFLLGEHPYFCNYLLNFRTQKYLSIA